MREDAGVERAGLVALGDSITYGEGGIVLGADGRSWALWLAMALDLPYTNYAVPGVGVPHVLEVQLARVRRPYDLGCLYIGVNDVRGVDFDLTAYARDLRLALAGLGASCERLLVCTIPLDLGRPPAGEKVVRANAAIAAAAGEHGAVVCDLAGLRGWRHVLPDAVHPTALGQLEIADRAARALGAEVRPSDLVDVDRSRRGLLRFARGWGREWAKDGVRRARERARRP